MHSNGEWAFRNLNKQSDITVTPEHNTLSGFISLNGVQTNLGVTEFGGELHEGAAAYWPHIVGPHRIMQQIGDKKNRPFTTNSLRCTAQRPWPPGDIPGEAFPDHPKQGSSWYSAP